ncbi:MAG: CoA-transferase [Chloroflexota bacterium]|nr:CoA-transferase [Chloroflexota bacterium]
MQQRGMTRELMCMRAGQELLDKGYTYVNLGIGIPTLLPEFVPQEAEIMFHGENGVLGLGRVVEESEWDFDLSNASGEPVTTVPGVSYFDSSLAFAMLRGSHVEASVVGAYEVSEKGDLANWQGPGIRTGSPGGSLDIAVGVKHVIAIMMHTTDEGKPRIVKQCSLAITAKGVISTIITNLAVMDVTSQGLILREVAQGITAGEVQVVTEPKLIVSEQLKEIAL